MPAHYDPSPSRRPILNKPGQRAARRERPKNPWFTLGKILYGILVAISAVIVGVYLAFTFFVKEPDVAPPPQVEAPEIPVVDVTDPGNPEDPGPEPLVRRPGVYNVLLAGTDAEGYRTDTMIVASYDTRAQKVGLVSVPRDTLVDRPKGENPKLVYGKGGVTARVEDIAEMLGIPIDYYVKIDLRGFIAVVDYLGGIDFYVPCDMDYDDPYQDPPIHIHYKEGLQHLNGQQVMEVSRFRKNNPDENGIATGYSDVGRTQTQQKLLIALAKKVLSWGSLTKINGFVEIFNTYVKTDLELNEMLYFASQAISIDISSAVETATLTGDGEVSWNGQRYCFQLDEQSTLDTVNRLINPYTREMKLEDMNIFTVK